MFYISIASASKSFTDWLRSEIEDLIGIKGHLSSPSDGTIWQLRYAKYEARVLIDKMYKNVVCISLSRKRLKISEILGTIAPLSPKVESACAGVVTVAEHP